MLKQTLPHSITSIMHPLADQHQNTGCPDLSAVNLFALQANHEAAVTHKSKSVNKFRRVSRKKTPADILKEGILKNRQSKRINSLKTITSDNLKLFLRIQDQKSTYKLTELHKELSCSILPLAKSHRTNRPQQQHEQSSFRLTVRCSSAASLKSRCASLRHISTSNPSASQRSSQLPSESNTHVAASRAISKLSFLTDKNDKENIAVNRLNPKQEEAIIMKKIGVKIPIDRQKLHLSKQSIDKLRTRQYNGQAQKKSLGMAGDEMNGVLTERRLDANTAI